MRTTELCSADACHICASEVDWPLGWPASLIHSCRHLSMRFWSTLSKSHVLK